MKLCDRCRVPGCRLNYLGTDCVNARAEACPEIRPNNAELIHNMSLDEMVVFLAAWAKDPEAWMCQFNEVRNWLKAEKEER